MGYPIHEMENIYIFRIVIMCCVVWHLLLMVASLRSHFWYFK